MWKWHGFSLSTALTWQSRIRTGGLSCIGRPRGVMLISHGFSESPGNAAAQDKDGSTPLHRASQRGELVLAWFLIENGADAAAQDNCGWTPLRWASRRGDLDLARYSLSMAPTRQPKTRTGGHHCPERPKRSSFHVGRVLSSERRDCSFTLPV